MRSDQRSSGIAGSRITARWIGIPAWIVMVTILWCGTAQFAQAAGPVLTLDQCISQTLEKSPAMESAAKTAEGAEWVKQRAMKDFLPKVSANYSYTLLDEAPKQAGMSVATGNPLMPTITIPSTTAGTRDNYQLTLSVTQTLFTGFAILSQYKLASLGLDVAEISKLQARLDLILQAKQAYFGVLQAEKGLDVADQSVKQLEAHLKEARSFYDVGMVPKNQVLQAEVKLAESVQRLTLAENQLKYARASLNTLLRRDLDAPLALEDILAYRPYSRNLNECTNVGLQTRPEVKAAQRKIEMRGQEVRLAQSGYYPNVAVSYNHIQKGDTWRTDGSPYNSNPNQWNVTATATWTLWEWGKTRDGVQYSRAEESKSRSALTQVEDAVRLEVKQSFLNLDAAARNISVSEKAREQAEENFRMSVERYREQVATSTEVTDAETLLTTARTNRYAALYNYNLAQATLERAMGAGK